MNPPTLEAYQVALATVNRFKSAPFVQEWLDAEGKRMVQAAIQRSADQYMARHPCITQADIDWLMADDPDVDYNDNYNKTLVFVGDDKPVRRGRKRDGQKGEVLVSREILLPSCLTHLWGGGARAMAFDGWGTREQQS